MIFNKTKFDSAYTIDLSPIEDERGFFARYFCENEFKDNNLNTEWKQINNSFSKDKFTLRGLHYQLAPSTEVKLVRCIKGSIWDVIVDLRERERYQVCFDFFTRHYFTGQIIFEIILTIRNMEIYYRKPGSLAKNNINWFPLV